MLALVTGASGFIGSHLCAALAARGHRVRILARSGSDLGALEGLEAEVALGDLRDPGSLPAACAGVECVFHLAGALKGFREEDLVRVNRDGTAALAAACPRDLKRFVLVSSLAAAGPSPADGSPRAEDLPEAPITWYGRSKLEGERAILASGLPSVILRPPVVFGPRERDVLSYFRIARTGLLPVPAGPDRFYSLVFGPDLAQALVRAGELPLPSGAIIPAVALETVSWAELGRRIARALGREGRILPLPVPAIRLAGRLADTAARLRGRPGIFSSQKVLEMLAPAWVASPEPSRRLLDWSAPTPLDQALEQTVRWYRNHGWI